MPDLINLLTAMACMAICCRLLTYRRGPDSRHRLGVGVCAWVLIASTGGQALQILIAGHHAHPSMWQLGVLLVLVGVQLLMFGLLAELMISRDRESPAATLVRERCGKPLVPSVRDEAPERALRQ